MLNRTSDFERAAKQFEAAMEWTGTPHAEAYVLNHLTLVYYHLGRDADAMRQNAHALRTIAPWGVGPHLMFALINRASLKHRSGDSIAAIADYGTVVQHARALRDRWHERVALGGLGQVYCDVGQYDAALACHTEALDIATQIGDMVGQKFNLTGLGRVHRGLQDYDTALVRLEQSAELARLTGDLRSEEAALTWIGLTYWNIGQPMRAVEYYERAISLARAAKNDVGQGTIIGNMGLAYASAGDWSKALDCNRVALRILTNALGPEHTLVSGIREMVKRIENATRSSAT